MKVNAITLVIGLVLLAEQHGDAQGTFQNLDFETANLPVVPTGQDGGFVSSLNAIPNWTAFFDSTQTTQILHNGVSLGAVNISILGPNFTGLPILQGSYSAILQSGLLFSTTRTSASIAQTGIIPATALSLQFFARQFFFGDPNQLVVSIGGQTVPLVSLSTTANYTVYGADISSFSGQTRELRISALPTVDSPYNCFVIDAISLSSQAVPEPNVFGLLGLGALFSGYRMRRLG